MRSTKKEMAMKKWEYKVLLCQCRVSMEVCYVNGENVKVAPLSKWLPELGEQGWEVCGMSPSGTSINGALEWVEVVLKRPLED
jgi:hypothetical protein